MIQGKCWIYKRATLYADGGSRIIDYSDGTEEFDATVFYGENGDYVYIWRLPQEIMIPLNVSPLITDSIIRSGIIKHDDGEIHWEFIFGKFKPYKEYYAKKLLNCMPFILIILFLLFIREPSTRNP